MNKKNIYWKLTILAGITAVIIGAFGAHGLKPHLPAEQFANFQTASKYHFIHTLAACIGLFIPENFHRGISRYSPVFFLVGILLFSGSIYLLSLASLLPFNPSFLGPVTPLGGLFFIVGWASLFTIKWE